MKMCFISLPIDFWNEHKDVVENKLNYFDNVEIVEPDYEYCKTYRFYGDMGDDVTDYFLSFHNELINIPKVIWQETDEGGYYFSYGMTTYYLPNVEKQIDVPHNHDYNVVNIAKLETLTSMDELKALIEKKKAENPIPNMDEVFKKYHEEFVEQFKRENCGL